MKKLIYVSIFLFGLNACAPSAQQSAEPKYNPVFSFEPEQVSAPNSAKISVALVNTLYSDEAEFFAYSPYRDFLGKVNNTIEEVLIAKGYTVKGPYKTLDDMVYGDKESADLVLMMELNLKSNNTTFALYEVASLSSVALGYQEYRYAGDFESYGDVSLTLMAPFSKEKVWKKNIDLDRDLVTANGNKKWPGQVTVQEMLTDTGIYNPIAKNLEKKFSEITTNIWRYLEPRELTPIVAQAKKADEKFRY